jgi:hypothetical protein
MVRRPRPRTIGQHMPQTFAVDADRPGVSITKELSKKRFCRHGCSKESRSVTAGVATKKFGAVQKRLAACRERYQKYEMI